MGTKNAPGNFDCYAKAKNDEPLFTLLARDPMGGYMVAMWGYLRGGNIPAAQEMFNRLQVIAQRPLHVDLEQVGEAMVCAANMLAWRAEPFDLPGMMSIVDLDWVAERADD